MTARFLSISVPKLLMVAGTDRLDNEMIKAQMMGKFQFVLLPACGHTIQEDVCVSLLLDLLIFSRTESPAIRDLQQAPEKVAESIVTFKNRFRL